MGNYRDFRWFLSGYSRDFDKVFMGCSRDFRVWIYSSDVYFA